MTPDQFLKFAAAVPPGSLLSILVGTPYGVTGEWSWFDQGKLLIRIDHYDDFAPSFSVMPASSIVSIAVKRVGGKGRR